MAYHSDVWDLAKKVGLVWGASARQILDDLEDSYKRVHDPEAEEVPRCFAKDTLRHMLRRKESEDARDHRG